MPIKSRIQDAGWAGMYFLMKQEEDAGFFLKKVMMLLKEMSHETEKMLIWFQEKS